MTHFIGIVALFIVLGLALFLGWRLFMSMRGAMITTTNCAKITRNVIRGLIADLDVIDEHTDLNTVNEYIDAQLKKIKQWKGTD